LYVTYPCQVNEIIQQQAQDYVSRILEKLDTKGLFAFEFFLTKDDQLLINESAPRPHNSGHITLDSMNCSQFENHMRAVAGLHLRNPETVKEHVIMVNLLGTQDGEFDPERVLSSIDDNDLSITFYGKQRSRIKRKMGHINMWGNNTWERARKLVADLEI